MPTTSVSHEQVPQKTADIVQNALADSLAEQGLIIPSNELQNIKNLVEGQAQALAQKLADQAGAEEYLAGDEFGQTEETTRRKTQTPQEQKAVPTGEEDGEVEKETTRERTHEETEPTEKPKVPTARAQPKTAIPTPQPILPAGIHAEAQPQEEPQGEVVEGQEPKEAASPEIAEAQNAKEGQETATEQPQQKEAAKETQKTKPQSKTPESNKEQEPQPGGPQETKPEEEQVPGAPSGDITPQEGAQQSEEEEKDKAETPQQADEPKTEQQQEAETKKAQQQARIQQGAAQTGEVAEAEKELKTLTDKARQFGPSLGKIMIPIASAIQEFLPLLDTGFIAGLVSIVTTASKALWFISQGTHLKEFVWKKAKARFAISSIIEVVPWLNWIPSALLTDILTLRNIREKRTEFTTQINALTAKIKKLGARR